MEVKNMNQSGMSLAEALMAIIISTVVMGTAYFIYNNFQQTFVRQINHNIIKQEVRFAIHSLQLDLKMAGYKHVDATTNVQQAIRLFDSDGNAVSDNIDADRVVACYDTVNNSGTVQRKIIEYQLGSDADSKILKKRIYNADSCNIDTSVTWEPVADNFIRFRVRKNNNILNFKLRLSDAGNKLIEKYNVAVFMRNISYD